MKDGLARFLDGHIRYALFLPPGKEHPMEMLLLKWHLLIEEELRELVAAKFVDKKAYELDRCKFSVLLNSVRRNR